MSSTCAGSVVAVASASNSYAHRTQHAPEQPSAETLTENESPKLGTMVCSSPAFVTGSEHTYSPLITVVSAQFAPAPTAWLFHVSSTNMITSRPRKYWVSRLPVLLPDTVTGIVSVEPGSSVEGGGVHDASNDASAPLVSSGPNVRTTVIDDSVVVTSVPIGASSPGGLIWVSTSTHLPSAAASVDT